MARLLERDRENERNKKSKEKLVRRVELKKKKINKAKIVSFFLLPGKIQFKIITLL